MIKHLLLQDVKIFYRHGNSTVKPIGNVLFLHGAAFSSENWLSLGALTVVTAMGYRPIAVDLPGTLSLDLVLLHAWHGCPKLQF